MRPFRFRAWNQKLKEMAEFGFDNIRMGLSGKGMVQFSDMSYHLTGSDLVITQSTGLKDANGVEIFEGDVVKGNGDGGRRHHVGVIEYEGYRFTMKDFHWGFYDHPRDPFSEEMVWEVIGNRFEHPHLLKADDENP